MYGRFFNRKSLKYDEDFIDCFLIILGGEMTAFSFGLMSQPLLSFFVFLTVVNEMFCFISTVYRENILWMISTVVSASCCVDEELLHRQLHQQGPGKGVEGGGGERKTDLPQRRLALPADSLGPSVLFDEAVRQ